jgi:hypothetical protein
MWKTFWRRVGIAYVLLALAPMAAIAVAFPVVEGWRWLSARNDWYGRDAVTAPSRAADLARRGLIEQIVTFRSLPEGIRVDAQTKEFDLYAIGVGQTTLPSDKIKPVKMFLDSGFPSMLPAGSDVRYASSSPVTGRFSNVLLLEPKTGALTKVFSSRVGVSSFQFVSGPGVEVLIALATERDTDKDGKLSDADAQSLYMFSLKDRMLRRVAGLTGNPVAVGIVAGQPYVVVRAIQDDNQDGLFGEEDYEQAPDSSRLFRVDLLTYASSPLVPADMMDQLQRTLDASASSGGAKKP